MFDLTAFGDPCTDHVYALADPWRPGGKMLGRYLGTFPGGTCANVACAAASLGLNTALVGRAPTGPDGEISRNSLTAFGVSLAQIDTVTADRGSHAIIAIGPDGEKSLIYCPLDGPFASPDQIGTALQQTRAAYCMAADFALFRPHLGATDALIIADFDAAAGMHPDQFAAIRDDLDLFFINEIGFAALLGSEPGADTVAGLLGSRARIACCTGGGGTTWMAVRTASGVAVTAAPARPVTVVDTTGAGDSFNAAFLAAHLTGATPAAALDLAMQAGARAVTQMGARGGMANRTLAQENYLPTDHFANKIYT